jgi:hypothetical protein
VTGVARRSLGVPVSLRAFVLLQIWAAAVSGERVSVGAGIPVPETCQGQRTTARVTAWRSRFGSSGAGRLA